MPPSATHHTLTYSDLSSLLKSLYSLQRHGIKLGLEHTYRLLESIGNPHDGLVFIHVAGTNGKGSTCAMISSMLRALGKKVGLYTSPHLLHFNERIRVDGSPISDQEIIMFMNACTEGGMVVVRGFRCMFIVLFYLAFVINVLSLIGGGAGKHRGHLHYC